MVAFSASLLSGLPGDLGAYDLGTAALGAFYGCVLFVLMMALSRYLIRYSESFRDLTWMLSQLFGQFTWPMIILVSIMAGVSEELLFRGVIQNWLMSFTSPWVAIVLSSLLFALMHFYNRLYFLITFIVSLMIAYLYLVTNSLLLVMVLHAVYDFLAFVSIVKYPRFFGFYCK